MRTACRNFIIGAVERRDRDRAPSAEVLAIEARRLLHQRQEEAERDKLYPRIRNVPPGYRTVAGGRFLVVPPGKPMPEGFSHVPMGKIDYGHGMIHLDGLTAREARVVENLKGILPDGRNLAMMSLDDKRAALHELLNLKAIA